MVRVWNNAAKLLSETKETTTQLSACMATHKEPTNIRFMYIVKRVFKGVNETLITKNSRAKMMPMHIKKLPT
jgi:hypothetical protein